MNCHTCESEIQLTYIQYEGGGFEDDANSTSNTTIFGSNLKPVMMFFAILSGLTVVLTFYFGDINWKSSQEYEEINFALAELFGTISACFFMICLLCLFNSFLWMTWFIMDIAMTRRLVVIAAFLNTILSVAGPLLIYIICKFSVSEFLPLREIEKHFYYSQNMGIVTILSIIVGFLIFCSIYTLANKYKN